MNKIIYFVSVCFLLVSCSADIPVSIGLVDALERIGIISGYSEYQNTDNEGISNAIRDERVYLSDDLPTTAVGSIKLKKAGFVSVGSDDFAKIALVSTIEVVSLSDVTIKDGGTDITVEASRQGYKLYGQSIDSFYLWNRQSEWQKSSLTFQYILAKKDTDGYTEFVLTKSGNIYTITDGGTLSNPTLLYKKM